MLPVVTRSVAARPVRGGPGFIAVLKRRHAWGFASAVVALYIVSSPAPAQDQGTDPALLADEMESMMPDRERTLIHLFLDGRRKYEAASPGLEREQCRLKMQAAVSKLVGEAPDVKNWVGVFRASHTNPEGDRSVRIEIAPGVTISTAQNRQDDPNLATLIEPHSDSYAEVDGIGVGQPIVFSGRILAGRLSSDDDMVEQPLLFAHFSSLRRAR